MLLVADGITCGCILETYDGDDVAGEGLVQLLPLVGVHEEDSSDSFLLLLGRIVYVGTCLYMAGVNSGECQTADEGIRYDLESQSGERLVIGCLPGDGISVHIRSVNLRDING